MEDLHKLHSTVRAIERRLNEMEVRGARTELGAVSDVEFEPVPQPPVAPPAANQVRNGDFSHSTNTWHEVAAAPGTDKVLECAHWYSHDAPAAAQVLNFSDARTSSDNKTLKAPTHSDYDVNYCDWLLPEGVARLTGTKSLDAPFPGNSVFAGRPMYFGAIIARRHERISISTDTRIAAMLYDHVGQDFMKSNDVFHLSGEVRGAPAGTTERRYKVLAETDRGYSFLSDELTLAAAPDNASFGSGVDVFLSWPSIEGVLRYRVFRHNVVAGTFDELRQITSGTNTFGDNNAIFDDNVGGYPASTDDRIKCFVATLDGALSNLPVNGVALQWASLFLNIPVPPSLAAAASGSQVLRIALSKALDRRMTDAESAAASNSILSLTGEFTARDTGRIATLFDEDGAVLHGPEAITFVDATHVTFATNVATANIGAVLHIVGGGEHGLLMDMAHIGYLSRASYAPYFEDLNRALPSTAAPNTSSQGGVGSPGDSGDPGDGGIGRLCVEVTTPITELFGNIFTEKPFHQIRRGNWLRSGNHQPNVVKDIVAGYTDNLHIIETANGVVLGCSPEHVLFTSFVDTRGTPLSRLKIGDSVLTCVRGRDECSPLIERIATGRRAKVGTFELGPGHKFIAGRLNVPWWKRWFYRLTGQYGCSGMYCHNVKIQD